MTRSVRRFGTGRPALPAGFGVVWATVAMDMVGFGIMLPVLPLYAEDFGASPAMAAAVIAVFSAAQMVAAPLWGRLSDRIGRKPVLIAALIGSSIGSLVTGLAGVLWVLFLGRVLDGASGSSYAVGQAAVADLAQPEDRPRLLGLLAAAFGVGFVAGPLIGSIAALGGRELPFFVAAALAAGNAIVALVRLPSGRSAGRSAGMPAGQSAGLGPKPGRLALWGAAGPAVRRLAVLSLVAMVGFAGFEATFAMLVEHRFPDVGDPTIYGLFALIGLLMVLVQTRIVGPVNARLGTRSTLRTALSLVAAGMVVLAMGGGWAGLAVALVLLVVGQGVFGPTLSNATVETVGADGRGSALGLQQSAGAFGRILGPLLAGVLFGRVAVGAPYLVAAALAVAALAVVPRRVAEESLDE
ncbi:MAG: MFS transporter [Actinomycetota bacterium]|nr:MFS transporter [Actinomycetota bacterium]